MEMRLSLLLACLLRAVPDADGLLAGVLYNAPFWQREAGTPMNARQTLVLNRVLDGMEGKLTNAKWTAIGNALRLRRCGISMICCTKACWRGWTAVGAAMGIYWSNRPIALMQQALAAIKNASMASAHSATGYDPVHRLRYTGGAQRRVDSPFDAS